MSLNDRESAAHRPQEQAPRGYVDGVLYCYGGCGTKYRDFPCDFLLPTPLWNRIAVGPPFDHAQAGCEREGRGGVLCPTCIVQRLAALPECTAVFADIEDSRQQLAAHRAEVERLRVDSHELALVRARVGERGVTDCSTPLPQRIENVIERLDKAEAEVERLTQARDEARKEKL